MTTGALKSLIEWIRQLLLFRLKSFLMKTLFFKSSLFIVLNYLLLAEKLIEILSSVALKSKTFEYVFFIN